MVLYVCIFNACTAWLRQYCIYLASSPGPFPAFQQYVLYLTYGFIYSQLCTTRMTNFCLTALRIEVTIADIKPEGSNVTEFQATDRDVGQDGRIDYTITAGNEDGFFGISGVGYGEVIVQRSPIFPHTYTLTITATDRGTPPRSSNATLIVHVTTSQAVDCRRNEFG